MSGLPPCIAVPLRAGRSRLWLGLVVSCLGGAVVPQLHAQTSTATFTVTATVLPSCTVVGGVPLAFGVVTPGTQRDGTVCRW